ncbi:Hypothetical protein R9X50_00640200 [Acrodontium crateriforme]|uniref:DUF221-domain-containing protein n=1 Tax=Acrodontium crateriforme TaxID=150365 RepID=A0AAQ3M7U5_9PEZI|nr:Hypothetical protein R9X50_00640200 [Acrodontium crateriforme]
MSGINSIPGIGKDCNTSGHLNFLDFINCGSGGALNANAQTIPTVLAAITFSAVSFGVQVLLFLALRLQLSRIYRPRSYLVPERERVSPPPRGLVQWLVPLFSTSNLSFIQKCGLDAYFFLRFLRTLLKFFLPVAIITLPILLPINRFSGSSETTQSVEQLAVLTIAHVAPEHVRNRLWAHLIIAIAIIIWFCYIVYQEMRGYIRVRQAYLTSPQHRIRASATTVLVSDIPHKWLTLEALSGLYDVFPGGIKNIWINRNFDELSKKVKQRDKMARILEDTETELIKLCRKKHIKAEKMKAKKSGAKKKSKEEITRDKAAEDAAADQLAQGKGVTAGDQGQTVHSMQDILHEAEDHEEYEMEKQREKQRLARSFEVVGQGFGVMGHGLGAIGKSVGALGQKAVGGLDGRFGNVNSRPDLATRPAKTGIEHAIDEDASHKPIISSEAAMVPRPEPLLADAEKTLAAEYGAHYQRPTTAATVSSPKVDGSPISEETLTIPVIQTTRPSVESKPQFQMQIELPESHVSHHNSWQFWKNNDHTLVVPSPQPHTGDEDVFPLNASAVQPVVNTTENPRPTRTVTQKLMFWKREKSDIDEVKEVYDAAHNNQCDEDQDGEPRWRQFIEPKDRQTIRLRAVPWLPNLLPFIGQKVDKIYYLRRELARLNMEIESDQSNIEKYPLMNSAFIQFNHQVAAHMACQSLSHHIPQRMSPRLVEISPDDVIWDNMSTKWWEHYVRTGVVLFVSVGLLILFAIPVTFTSLLGNLYILGAFPGLHFFQKIPRALAAVIQGAVPPLLLMLILLLVPIIYRLLVKQQGVQTGSAKELGVQAWYFTFLFIQVFFIATLSSGLPTFFKTAAQHPDKIVTSLAQSLPQASSYFFSYLMVQALSNSATDLLQLLQLYLWFIKGPLSDSTPRRKWRRQTHLNTMQWGSFFPPFANFAVIGIIYSVIAPLILVFILFVFSLFWIVNRYNVLYVWRFENDTGGLLFPTALNQLFTGVYFLELSLIGFFFISRDQNNNVACIPQGVIMIIAMIFTIIYQVQLNRTFQPLFQYLPITLEDEAVIRDEAFAKAQASKHAPLINGGEQGIEDDESLQDALEARERREEEESRHAEAKERQCAHEQRQTSDKRSSSRVSHPKGLRRPSMQAVLSDSSSSWKTDRWRKAAPVVAHGGSKLRNMTEKRKPDDHSTTTTHNQSAKTDIERQGSDIGDVLYAGYADELEDLTPEERDLLTRYAFQHSALRARRPAVWIPRDNLGVSDDEIRRAERMSTVEVTGEDGQKTKKTNIWMSNEGTALDAKGRAVFRRSPPDFSNVDLIAL